MALLRRLYGKLHLTVNEAKSAVASVFGRKFLGYSFWLARGGEVKRRVADKPLATFQQRVRWLTRRSGGRSMQGVVDGLRPYLLGWKAYFGLAQTPRSGERWTRDCVTGCAPSNLSSGSVGPPCTASCVHWVPVHMWPDEWRRTAVAGGATVRSCSTAY